MQQHDIWFMAAVKVAQRSLCERARCGSVIVSDGEIIGEGYNAPPLDKPEHAYCLRKEELNPGFKSDRTCCVHAEQRAVMDSLARRPRRIREATLYFARIDESGKMLPAGRPYCTICSKTALDVGVARFGLWHDDGPVMYRADRYNDLSFAFGGG